ncbi:unnamed protein product, partial [Sphacelaria rigidula]
SPSTVPKELTSGHIYMWGHCNFRLCCTPTNNNKITEKLDCTEAFFVEGTFKKPRSVTRLDHKTHMGISGSNLCSGCTLVEMRTSRFTALLRHTHGARTILESFFSWG